MPSVLVVEDDQDLAEMLGIVLNGAGIEVDLVSRGDEVLDVFKTNQPDVVLLDVMLPGLDGVEICKAIREESARFREVAAGLAPPSSQDLSPCSGRVPGAG